MSLSVQPAEFISHRRVRSKTILVVDDEEALLQVLALLLEDEGYRVIVARNGPVALERLREEGVDVVVTDFMMPGMSGAELMRVLHEGPPPTPVILMSALDEAMVSRKCTGYAHFFRKPFDVPEFLEAVARLTAGSGRRPLAPLVR